MTAPSPQESYPERHIQIIARAYENCLDTPEIVAYHGTALQVLKDILRTGKQQGSNWEDLSNPEIELQIRKGDIFVFPIEGRTEIKGFKGSNNNEEALKNARIYANYSAFEFYVMELLGLGLRSRDYQIEGNMSMTKISGLKDYYDTRRELE